MIPGARTLTWAVVVVIVVVVVGLMYIAYNNSEGNDTSSAVGNTASQNPSPAIQEAPSQSK